MSLHQSQSFGDLLDPRFQRIFHEHLPQQDDMLPELYNFEPTNGRNNMQFSDVGSLSDWDQFTGQVTYQQMHQGYDTTLTPVEFASGIQVERALFDDDQYSIMDRRPEGLATAYQRTRQKHGARLLNNAFSVDTFFYVNSEGVALCSDSHTTNSGASTAAGFDNMITSAFSAVALQAGWLQAKGFRDDQGGRFAVNMNEIWYPPDLQEKVWEVINSMGKVDTAENNRNIHFEKYSPRPWDYLTSSANWFLADSRLRNMMVHWTDRIAVEFAFAEDLDTIIAKWRGYARYGNAWSGWRWALGANVT